VTYPAYPQTSAALRSMERARVKDTDDGLLDDLLLEENDFSEFDELLNDI
jgi:ABC-type transport system involved in cytochrome c biogenesis permease component